MDREGMTKEDESPQVYDDYEPWAWEGLEPGTGTYTSSFSAGWHIEDVHER